MYILGPVSGVSTFLVLGLEHESTIIFSLMTCSFDWRGSGVVGIGVGPGVRVSDGVGLGLGTGLGVRLGQRQGHDEGVNLVMIKMISLDQRRSEARMPL